VLWDADNTGPTSCPSHRYDGFFEDLRVAGAPEVLTMESLKAYCDALNTSVINLEAKLHAALGLIIEGAVQAQAATVPE